MSQLWTLTSKCSGKSFKLTKKSRKKWGLFFMNSFYSRNEAIVAVRLFGFVQWIDFNAPRSYCFKQLFDLFTVIRTPLTVSGHQVGNFRVSVFFRARVTRNYWRKITLVRNFQANQLCSYHNLFERHGSSRKFLHHQCLSLRNRLCHHKELHSCHSRQTHTDLPKHRSVRVCSFDFGQTNPQLSRVLWIYNGRLTICPGQDWHFLTTEINH